MTRCSLMIIIALIFCCGGANTNAQDISLPFLEGEWSLNYLDGFYCNVCPKVYFDSGSCGRIVYPSDEGEEFCFVLSENNIVFSSDDESDFFGSSEFECELSWNDALVFLNLTAMDGNHEFTLIRGK